MAHHTPFTGTLRRLRRGRSLVGVAIDSERLDDIEHGRVLPTREEVQRLGRFLGLTLPELRELEHARHRAYFVQIHRQAS